MKKKMKKKKLEIYWKNLKNNNKKIEDATDDFKDLYQMMLFF